jgi:hypothetical protein
MPTTPIANWGTAIVASLAGALAMIFAAVPKILAFLVIVAIGWFVAGLLAKAVAALLRSARFNDLSQRSGFTGFLNSVGLRTDPAGGIALTVRWFVRLIALAVAFDALGLPAVSDVGRRLLLWLPNLAVALAILVIGGMAANAVGGLVRGAAAEGGIGNPDLLGRVARAGVLVFAIVVAVNQVGIAQTLVNALFMGLVFAFSLATGLSFGLGARETAGQIVQGWYQRSRESAPRFRSAAAGAVSEHSESGQYAGGWSGVERRSPRKGPWTGLERRRRMTPPAH